jgi:Trk K+ transport system NAD-binding subunit
LPNTGSSRITLRQRLRYRFDGILARGMWAVLLWLGVVAVLFFVAIAVLIRLSGVGPGDASTSFGDGLWLALTRSLDPGTFSGDDGTRFRLIMLVVTLSGIFLAATIIGLVSSAIDRRVESLRRGRSFVVEEGHSLVIGWTDKVPTIVSELVEAHASERGRAIVVLSPEDVVDVSDEIRAAVPDLRTSRLVVRSGAPTRLHDLRQVNAPDARSAIVLRPTEGSDAQVVKTVLALANLSPGLERTTVVAELDDRATAASLRDAVGPSLITVTPMEIIARISAQVSRAAGLGTIYQELLDFEGDEMYLVPLPGSWVGRSFGELLLASSSATVIGIDRPGSGVLVGPDPTTPLEAGDRVIGIAEDDSTFVLDRDPVPWALGDQRPVGEERPVERTLMVGWSDLAPLIAQEIENHVARGSELHVLVPPGRAAGVADALTVSVQRVVVHQGDPIDRGAIASVMAAGPFDHVMLLADRDECDPDEADARTLLTLMHVRSVAVETEVEENVVAELLDPNDVELGAPSATSDFIVSQRLISLLLAQLSESPELSRVFAELFDSDGVVISIRPLDRYLPAAPATFADVVRAAREHGDVAIGYRCAAHVDAPGALPGGLRLNPPKDETAPFTPGDSIVVITRPAG